MLSPQSVGCGHPSKNKLVGRPATVLGSLPPFSFFVTQGVARVSNAIAIYIGPRFPGLVATEGDGPSLEHSLEHSLEQAHSCGALSLRWQAKGFDDVRPEGVHFALAGGSLPSQPLPSSNLHRSPRPCKSCLLLSPVPQSAEGLKSG